ncbi:stage II sporulation protein D [Marinisporobacter balticus]|uniref:Stage II sporulation protein D n=1 Tax=Marinisporobacter balticus TaxID=2018667 RepID=A0A4R2L0M1_9FIRM|nr:stage II sporulation protein D [Marinisporobacter balticus]TCO78727.1 stage II sporulation protein D [Marinisporobacter balticus]
MDDGNILIYVKIYDHIANKVVLEPMPQLIKRMVASQIPISFEIEALKAQSIIARTFIIRNMKFFGGKGCSVHPEADICTDGHCGKFMTEEVFQKKWRSEFKKNWEKLDKAVNETEGKIITMKNKPIDARFHHTCGGATENSENIEGNKTLYLRKVLCEYCRNSPYYKHSLKMTLEEIEEKLNIKILESSPLKGPDIDGIIEDVERDDEGRIVSVKIGGKKLKGTEIMKLLGLNSTRFGWKPITFQIEMQGKGEGLGLCQYGANTMALEGKNAEEILNYYFTGIQIKEFDRPSIKKPLAGKIIVIDAGHGGNNTEDATGPTGLREKDVNLSISLKLAQLLRNAGAQVYETRTKDTYVSLSKRANLAHEVKPHFFLSIHQNFFSNPNISGSEIYHYRGDKEGENLANIILEELWNALGTARRGTKVANFYLFREVRSSVLQIEVAYITNPDEEEKLRDEKFKDQATEAIANALIRYYRYG